MSIRVVIECVVQDESKLLADWGSERHHDDIIDDYNEYYRTHPMDGFELALRDPNFKTTSTVLTRVG